jgi:phenylacetate-CoA ligase
MKTITQDKTQGFVMECLTCPMFAAGFRPGDVVLNTFSYHLTPGGFIFDASARALGCAVIPAGRGNTEAQFELIEAYRPVGYSGTPDFLKILLDAATSANRDVSSIKRTLVSGAAFPKSLQDEIKSRGVMPIRRSAPPSRPDRIRDASA